MIVGFLKLILIVLVAMLAGKLFAKIKLPAILGWLISGMILGPYALNFLNYEIIDSSWYQIILNIAEVSIGLMIGTELIWGEIKKAGKQIFIITITESIGTFLIVSAVFASIFLFMDIPAYLGLIFGGIALATAPAPSLSVVNEYKTDGPVTRTLIPLTALDDILALIVFFSVIGMVSNILAGQSLPAYFVPLSIIAPIILGIILGYLASFVLNQDYKPKVSAIILFVFILIASGLAIYLNSYVFAEPLINLIILGISFSATFSNIIKKERLYKLMTAYNPILGISLIIIISSLGAPLDYSLILSAGLFTAIYIISRGFGKIVSSYFGGVISKAPETVKKYLGLTLLPHSGVSLVFTGIAVNTLMPIKPEYASIIQGTIAAAAIINEFIAIYLAKQGFKLAGEIGAKKNEVS